VTSGGLVIDRVSKHFGSVQALTDISLELGKEGITGIIGPNGSGKSTLVNVVSGILRPSSGTVSWEGKKLTGLSPNKVVRRGISRTFQESMTFSTLSVHENLVISVEAAGKKRGDANRLLYEEGLFEPLIPHADRRAADLPFGLARLLGIAIAMASDPRLLVLDEPAAGLNDVEARELANAIESIRDRGTAVAMIDHDMAFLLPLCERVIVLDAGTLLADGSPSEIRANASVIRTYLGEGFAGR
jgi:branched-chain amino acid transport system ATP-binding protein